MGNITKNVHVDLIDQIFIAEISTAAFHLNCIEIDTISIVVY